MKLELQTPVQFGSREIRELELREPRAKDMRSLKGEMTFGDLLDLVGALAGEPQSVIDMLSPNDARRAVEHVGNLFAAGGPTS